VSIQHWQRGLDRPILMIPGPTEVPWRVIRAMAQPAMIQYEPPFDDEILEPACLDLRQVFQTSGEVIAMPGSGRTGLEAAAVSLVEPGDRVVVVVAGVFGSLMKEVVRRMRDAYGILVSTGIEGMRESVLRVGTMGVTASPLYVLPTLSALGMALRDLGDPVDTGEALAAAQAVFDAESP
jgi:aspartate aminotransferase-like enzyme